MGQLELISPPPAFRSSEPALNMLESLADTPARAELGRGRGQKQMQKLSPQSQQAEEAGRETQLTSKLTRTRRQQMPSLAGGGTEAGTGTGSGPELAKMRNHRLNSNKEELGRTLTRFEQCVIAPMGPSESESQPGRVETRIGAGKVERSFSGSQPARGCRFKAQVMFESDTDSMSVSERHSGASQSSRNSPASSTTTNWLGPDKNKNPNARQSGSSQRRPRKELVSETKYSSTVPTAPDVSRLLPLAGSDSKLNSKAGAQSELASGQTLNRNGQILILEPSWDYSLRVNRMRGNKVDSKVK